MAKKRGIPKADLYGPNYTHTLTVPIDRVEPLLEVLGEIQRLTTDSPEIQALIEKAFNDWTYKT